jgi:RNA polymerase sigma factor (sigma-70 family)
VTRVSMATGAGRRGRPNEANECLRRARRTWRGDELTRPDTTVSAEDDVMQRLEAQRVAAAVAELPADQRRVLIMRDIQGYAGRAVADALGLSTPAMKSRLHRARATVRQRLLPDPSLPQQHDR